MKGHLKSNTEVFSEARFMTVSQPIVAHGYSSGEGPYKTESTTKGSSMVGTTEVFPS